MTILIRSGQPADVSDVLSLMRRLAEHEGLLQYFEMSEESLRHCCFDVPRRLELLVAEDESAIVGYASYMTQFSPWGAQDYLYLDDLYVSEAARGRGAGSLLMRRLGTIALERGIGVRWHVETASAAQQFYRSLGAELRDRFSAYWSLDAIRAAIDRP